MIGEHTAQEKDLLEEIESLRVENEIFIKEFFCVCHKQYAKNSSEVREHLIKLGISPARVKEIIKDYTREND